MLKQLTQIACSWAIILQMAQVVVAQDSIESLEETAIQQAIETAKTFTVQIETIGGLATIDGVRTTTGPTTGVVVSADGYVVSSSFNFIGQPASILIRDASGQRMSAKIVGRDLSRKLVLLKFDPNHKLAVPRPVAVTDIEVGQTVIAIGRTFSGDNVNVSLGIVSAKNRIWGKAVQTDAKISPANFGGALVNLAGNVLGVLAPLSPDDNTDVAGLEWYDSGIGFAIPMTDILSCLDQLIEGKTLRSGLLGVSFQNSDIYADPAVVASVFPATPAARSGLQAGDEIVALDGKPVVRFAQLKHAIGPRYEHDRVKVQVNRDDQLLEFEIPLVGEIEPYQAPLLGILPSRNGETSIRWVIPESPAAESGMIEGDQINQINGRPIELWEDVEQALMIADPDQPMTINIVRNESSVILKSQLAQMTANPFDDYPKGEIGSNEVKAYLTEIQVPEVSNQCFALVPLTRTPKGILVWLAEPGNQNKESLEKIWQKDCIARNTIILFPQSRDPSQWRAEESDFIVKTVDVVAGRYEIDRNLIAIGGIRTAGAMAALTAFGQRKLFGGLICMDSVLPEKLQELTTDPTQRLLILLTQSDSFTKTDLLQKSLQRLRSQKFPVHIESTGNSSIDSWASKILEWVDTLDRL